jgi:hypothetical protein
VPLAVVAQLVAGHASDFVWSLTGQQQ